MRISRISALLSSMYLCTSLFCAPLALATQTVPKPQIHLENFKQAHWSAQEWANVQVVTDFVQHLMNEHDFEYILEHYQASDYIQHNRAMESELKGVVKYLKNLTEMYPEYSYDVKAIMADGNRVILHSHVTLKSEHRNNQNEGFIIFDTWRLEKGQIVEHWDALQPLDPMMLFVYWLQGGEIKNQNGLF